MNTSRKAIREKAEKVLDKTAAYGVDIDLKGFSPAIIKHPYQNSLSNISNIDRQQMLKSGLDILGKNRAGTFIQIDHSPVHCSSYQEDVEILSITKALEKYEWLDDYLWKAVPVDMDKYTARAELHQGHGYFIRSLPRSKIHYPLQACLYIKEDNIIQDVHNIIIAEEGSELHIITGCATDIDVKSGLHVGISEFYVKKGAKLTFTMIHNWAEDIAVRPRSAAIVEEEGLFLLRE